MYLIEGAKMNYVKSQDLTPITDTNHIDMISFSCLYRIAYQKIRLPAIISKDTAAISFAVIDLAERRRIFFMALL